LFWTSLVRDVDLLGRAGDVAVAHDLHDRHVEVGEGVEGETGREVAGVDG
jgi:hypothetical protein